MYRVDIAQIIKCGNFGDWEMGNYETWMTQFYDRADAEIAMEESLYQQAADNGYEVVKLKADEFRGLIFGTAPITYKFVNSEDPTDIQYSSYRVVKNNYLEEEVI
jgi:hypothetical protein